MIRIINIIGKLLDDVEKTSDEVVIHTTKILC
jgi:hypothetical protein